MTKKILIVVGTRPNFIKVTQFKRVAKNFPELDVRIVHTGQHYNKEMAEVFFDQFNLRPDFFLNIPPSTPNTQMAEIMLRLEKLINEEFRPDLMIVPGDVNSTFASALTANKMGIRLAHLESGLRSHDRTMPEEFNRILTDEVSDYYFITEQSGIDNLTREHKRGQQILVGNTMIDTMVAFEEEIAKQDILEELELEKGQFVLMTIHRPATVDHEEGLTKLLALIESLSKDQKIVFPIHPRTVKNLERFGLYDQLVANDRLIRTPPMGYFQFQKLVKDCGLIITDSGGIQEESTFRQVPCLTLRPNTERPSTVTEGTNTLIPFDLATIEKYVADIRSGTYKTGAIPRFWDGKATERILKVLSEVL